MSSKPDELTVVIPPNVKSVKLVIDSKLTNEGVKVKPHKKVCD